MEISGVILAAGMGSRMGSLGEKIPKALLPICNRPLIYYHIDYMKQCGITDIYIVIGHCGDQVTSELQDGDKLGVNITYVEQHERQGIAHAVGLLRGHINKPFLLFLGDIFFEADNMPSMVEQYKQQQSGAVLAVKLEKDVEAVKKNYTVELREDGLVERVIEKPQNPVNNRKGVGLYLFDVSIFDAIAKTPRSSIRNEYEITDSIQILIDGGEPVTTSEVILQDLNLTHPEDILRCNLYVANKFHQGSVVDSTTLVPDDVTISLSVIGANVKIKNSVKISNSLIFENTNVDSEEDINYSLLDSEHFLDCTAQVKNWREIL